MHLLGPSAGGALILRLFAVILLIELRPFIALLFGFLSWYLRPRFGFATSSLSPRHLFFTLYQGACEHGRVPYYALLIRSFPLGNATYLAFLLLTEACLHAQDLVLSGGDTVLD